MTTRSVVPGSSRQMTVVRPMSSLASDVILVPSGPWTSWSIAAATRRPDWRVWWTSVAPAASLRCCSATSGLLQRGLDARVAAVAAGICSLATSSDCTTISAGCVDASTS